MALIDHLDHLVLTCVDPDRTTHFYTEVLQMQLETFSAGRLAFRFGNQKINLHVRGAEFEPKAHVPVPGALDLCFIAAVPLDDVIARLAARRPDQHIVVTGRNAKPALIEIADLVTEMTPVKHHFAAGVKAQEGIEF